MKKELSGIALVLGLMSSVWADSCDSGYRLFEHAAGADCIPVNPQRIVTLQDQNALLPLMELGVKPIASAGHITASGEIIFRRMQGYDTSGIEFIGTYGDPDYELVVAQSPDLIIASPWPEGAYEQFSKIAPTIVIDVHSNDLETALFQFADAVNRTDRAQLLQENLETKAAELKAELGEKLSQTTMSVISPEWQGTGFDVVSPTQAWGAILRILQPTLTPAEKNVDREGVSKSIESIGEHSADVMFLLTFDSDQSANSVSFNEFKSRPLLQVLPVVEVNQFYNLNGGEMVGASWGKIENGLDQIATVLRQENLNRNLVVEK